MEIKYKFFFDYIYYRIIQAYFKWDGRNGATALICVVTIQTLLILDIIAIITRLFFERPETVHYVGMAKWFAIILYFVLMICNYKRYQGRYNKLRLYWKDEDKTTRIGKGFLVILAFIIPWVPLILIGTLM